MKKNKSNDSKALYRKNCKYIGSIAVRQQSVDDRQQFINEKFDEMKDVVKGIAVMLMVTEEGVKVLNEDGSIVKMAHSVSRIIFSTCQPERKLFAFVSKTLDPNRGNIVQAHMFKTKKSSHTKELNVSLSKAFKIAYSKATINRLERTKTFDVENAQNRETKIKGKRWAKQEIAMGHKYAEHAQHASSSTPQPVEEKVSDEQVPQNRVSQPVDEKPIPEKVVPRPKPDLSGYDTRVQTQSTNQNKTPSNDQNRSQEQSSEKIINKLDSSGTAISAKGLQTEQLVDGPSRVDVYQELIGTEAQPTAYEKPIDCSSKHPLNSSSNAPNINNDINSPRVCILPKPHATQEDILPLTNDIRISSSMDGTKRPPINFVSPAQRFSSIDETERFSISDSKFEGYVNILDKKDEPLPPLPSVNENRESELFEMTEEDILKDAEWFQAGFSREIAESILGDRSIGSFFVRNSQSQIGAYVLTVKIPISCKPTGIGNFLIEVNNGEYKLKGFKPVFESLTDLVAHYGSCKEDIPVQLSLGFHNKLMQQNNKDERNVVAGDNAENEEEECEDSDYQYFTSPDDMLKELAGL